MSGVNFSYSNPKIQSLLTQCQAYEDKLEKNKFSRGDLYRIIKDFRNLNKEISTYQTGLFLLASSVKCVSNLTAHEYIFNHRYSFFLDLFDRIRNLFTFGSLKSSYQLGLELSTKVYHKALNASSHVTQSLALKHVFTQAESALQLKVVPQSKLEAPPTEAKREEKREWDERQIQSPSVPEGEVELSPLAKDEEEDHLDPDQNYNNKQKEKERFLDHSPAPAQHPVSQASNEPLVVRASSPSRLDRIRSLSPLSTKEEIRDPKSVQRHWQSFTSQLFPINCEKTDDVSGILCKTTCEKPISFNDLTFPPFFRTHVFSKSNGVSFCFYSNSKTTKLNQDSPTIALKKGEQVVKIPIYKIEISSKGVKIRWLEGGKGSKEISFKDWNKGLKPHS